MKKLFFFIWLPTIGLFGLFRKQHKPADESNRLFKVCLMWLSTTSPERIREAHFYFTNMNYFKLVWESTFNEELFVDFIPGLEYDVWELLAEHAKSKREPTVSIDVGGVPFDSRIHESQKTFRAPPGKEVYGPIEVPFTPYRMTEKANGILYHEFMQTGWTHEQLVEYGYIVDYDG